MASLWLRIIHINDVYELDNLPNFKSLVEASERGPDKTIVVLAGDFLGPSLLGSLDQGAGMVDVLNAVGITHVCFGNHETDVPFPEIRARILQSKFRWVNSNMREIDEKLQVDTPAYEILEVSNGNVSKKVCLLGLLTNDPGLYRPGSFGGCKIEPIVPTTEKYLQELQEENIDLYVPMTHQSIHEDRNFANLFGGETFPIILGGHEHSTYNEEHNGARIIKTGQDADQTAIIDFKWEEKDKKPAVDVSLIPTANFPPHHEVKKRCLGHLKIVKELETAKLFKVGNWMIMADQLKQTEFSTQNNRLQPTVGSVALTTMIRMGMRCHCALINAGSIRGSQVYSKDSYFTYKDLKAEIPFPTCMTSLYIPGRVIQSTIMYSRRKARLAEPVESGGYIQTCSNIQYNDTTGSIESMCGGPFDPERDYLTTLPVQFLQGIDDQKPLLEWATSAGVTLELDRHVEAGVPAKVAIVQAFSALIWLRLGSFHEIDADSDGVLTRDEVKSRITSVFGVDVADIVVDNIMSVADLDDDGVITPLEMCITQFAARDMLSHVCTKDELKIMKDVAFKVLGPHAPAEKIERCIEKLRETMDTSGDQKISREEAMNALGQLHTNELFE